MRGWIRKAVLSAAFMPAMSLAAQRPISVGLAGGVSMPSGDLRDAANTGWHGLGTIALSAFMQPIGFRVDLAYNQFALSDAVRAALDADGSQTVGSATLNITYRLPMTNSPMSPYLISGLGAYQTRCSNDTVCDATTRYGWNVGLGTRLAVPRLRTFIEARYHRTEREGRPVHFFPLTVGLMF
jgi:hypothetical protein